jgi:hypothetical protein
MCTDRVLRTIVKTLQGIFIKKDMLRIYIIYFIQVRANIQPPSHIAEGSWGYNLCGPLQRIFAY